MTSRERFHAAMAHKEADRIPIDDTPWQTTVERWHREGLPEGVHPRDYFGYERRGAGANLSFQFEAETLEEGEDHKIVKDAWGATTRVFKGRESVPELLDYTFTSRAIWEEHKHRYTWNDTRVNWAPALAGNRGLMSDDSIFLLFSAGFGYDRIQRMCGAPRVLMAMIEEPAWVQEMMDMTADLIVAAFEDMWSRGFRFDGAFIWNDQAYRNGTFFSPAAYRQFEFPCQKRMIDCFHAKGLPVIMHTDGAVHEFIPFFIEAGLDGLQPLEVKAGMDLVDLKQRYGETLAFMGGIDARAMAHPDPAVIEEEIRTKIPVAKKGGGYIFHSDHSVPDDVSFEQYCRVMELVREHGRF